MAEMLNKEAYTVDPNDLVRAAELPTLRRVVEITNPKTEVKRGQAIAYDASKKALSAGGETDANIVAIVAEDLAADTSSEKVAVSCYVAGAFNANRVIGPTVTQDVVLGAQSNGIYLV